MTVNTFNTETKTVADGIDTIFTFNFQTLDASWVLASVISPAGAETSRTDITVAINADQENFPGGTVTFDTAPLSGYTVRIYRNTPLNQQTDYTDYDAFPAESHEDALDKLTLIAQEQSGNQGQTSNDFTEILLNHTTNLAGRGSYRLQFRDFVGSPVFFLEPTDVTGDRSVLITSADGTDIHQFDFSRNGFLGLEAMQIFTPGISGEAVRYDLLDLSGTITITAAPVSADKLHDYRFTTDSTTGSEVYAGFRTTGTGYGSDPTQLDEFVTLDFFNNNTPGQGGILNLINQTNSEVLRVNYDEILTQNVVTATPVDANKNTSYNFFCDTTTGSEIVIAFKSSGRIGLPTAPVDNEDAVRLQDLNGILNNPDLTGTTDFINQTETSKKYTLSVDTIAGGNTLALFPNANNSGITWQTRSSGGTNYDWFFSNAGLTTLPGQLAIGADPTAGNQVGDRAYNDNRYAAAGDLPASWQLPVAQIEYNPAGGGSTIGTARGCTAAVVNVDNIRVTLNSAVSSMANMKVQVTCQDAVFAGVMPSYTKVSTTVVDINVRDDTGASGAAVCTITIWDNG